MGTNKMEIYNLEFPDNVEELNIGAYFFTRTSDYDDRLKELAHNCGLFETSHGGHHVTALMTLPPRQKVAGLPWENPEIYPKKPKKHLDLFLILSLLTERNVFAKTWNDMEGKRQILEDPRQHRGDFSRFVLPIGKNINNQTREIIDDAEMNGLSTFEWIRFNQGLEIVANKVWDTIKDESWQKKYKNGAFLLIFSQSQRMQRTESAFILSWSIWEHIFSLHHSSCMSDVDIEKKGADQKYEYIKNIYFQDDKLEKIKKDAKKIQKIRNRLIHFGFFPKEGDKNQDINIDVFFRDTEQLVAKILKLAE